MQRPGEVEQRRDDARQAVDLGDDEVARPCRRGVVHRDRLPEPLRGRADDGEGIADLVRDRGGELAERGELLALHEPGAAGVERLELCLDECRRLPVSPPRLGRIADEVAEERERRPEGDGDERAHVAPVHLERHAEHDHQDRVDDGEGETARGRPPAGGSERAHVARCRCKSWPTPRIVARPAGGAQREARCGGRATACGDGATRRRPWARGCVASIAARSLDRRRTKGGQHERT